MPKLDKPALFLLNLFAVQAKLQKRIDNSVAIHGISFSEFVVMQQLSKAPERTMRRIDLAGEVGLTASGITRLIAPMIKNKLVSKQANARDARVSLVKLTDVGAEILKDSSITFKQVSSSALQGLSSYEIDQLSEMVGRVHRN